MAPTSDLPVDQPAATAPPGKPKILLGVCGGIAAYKSAELIRQLTAIGADVQPVMTANAHRFITPLTLQALCGRPVRATLFDEAAEAAMGHIELARWADLILIAPATANSLARLAHGLADDLLSTLCLATTAPIAVAPAMNQQMWLAAPNQRNIETLRGDGVHILGPGSGDQACGEVGPGRMLEPSEIAAAVRTILQPTAAPDSPQASLRVLITAGPTREALDPVRYLSNHSTGKQGFELARAFAAAGAQVTLVAGPVSLASPPHVKRVDVVSARDMYEAVMAEVGANDVFISVAAVADYRPKTVATKKIKKEASQSSERALELIENPDIVASVARLPDAPFTIGFAAETDRVLDHARAKRIRKGLDGIIVNDVADQTIGFSSDHNAVTLIWDNDEQPLARAPKSEISSAIVAAISKRYWQRERGAGRSATSQAQQKLE